MMPVFRYVAYGLTIESQLPLPEMIPLRSCAASQDQVEYSGKINIRFTSGSEYVSCEDSEAEATFRFEHEEVFMAWKGIGRFWLLAGREIRIEPATGVAEATLRTLLLGPVLATALHQRGLLILHAAAVALHNRNHPSCVVGFLGHSGDGKSTMAAALHARGHQLVGDDIIAVPIEPAAKASSSTTHTIPPLISPSYPQLRLWPQSLRAVGLTPDTFPLLHPGQERRVQSVSEQFSHSPTPLYRMYVLELGDTVQIEPLPPAQALMKLVQYSYLTGWLPPAQAARQLRQCAALLQSVSVFRLRRPRDLTILSQGAEAVERDAIPLL